jgi:F0F1-type ATP synthase membrane subunit a
MTQTFYVQGRRSGLLSTVARTAFLAVAAIGGLFMLVFSAAFALFAVAGIAVIGFLIFAFFWAKAKISGKPFGPRAMMDAQLNQMRKEMEAQMGGRSAPQSAGQGPVVDAHRTPDGWSVDD